jgi:hypothetical protein
MGLFYIILLKIIYQLVQDFATIYSIFIVFPRFW